MAARFMARLRLLQGLFQDLHQEIGRGQVIVDGIAGLSCLKAAALKVIMDGAHVVERSFSHGVNVVYI
jgi:hypothetical protein